MRVRPRLFLAFKLTTCTSTAYQLLIIVWHGVSIDDEPQWGAPISHFRHLFATVLAAFVA